MLNRLLKLVIPLTITVGTILIAFQIANVNGLTVITQKTVNYGSFTWQYYYFDVYKYLKNLDIALNDTSILGIAPSEPIAPEMPSNTIDAWLKFIANSVLIYITNWLIYVLNWIILAPLKILIYPINILLTIFGIDSSNDSYIQVIRSLYTWQIPNISYL